jgi:hypothetical protein
MYDITGGQENGCGPMLVPHPISVNDPFLESKQRGTGFGTPLHQPFGGRVIFVFWNDFL